MREEMNAVGAPLLRACICAYATNTAVLSTGAAGAAEARRDAGGAVIAG